MKCSTINSKKNGKTKKERDAEDDAILEEAIKNASILELNQAIIKPSLDILPYVKVITRTDYRKRYFTSFSSINRDIWTEFTNIYMNNDLEKNTSNCDHLLQIVDRMKAFSKDPTHQEFFGFLSFFVKIQIMKFASNPTLPSIPDNVLQLLHEQNETFQQISPTDTTILSRWSSQSKVMLKNISTEFEPSIVSSAIVSKCYFNLASALMFLILNKLKEASIDPTKVATKDDFVELQYTAAYSASYAGGWKNLPESMFFQAMSLFVQCNFAEAVLLFTSALKSKSQYKLWCNDIKALTYQFLEKARQGMHPCLGDFVQVNTASAIGARFGAGYDQDKNKLYVFGGLNRPTSSGKDIAQDVRESIREQVDCTFSYDVLLNDLNVYDFLTEKWSRVNVVGDAPAPRGFCQLKLNKAENTLWMMGGRERTRVGDSHLHDLWSFSFETSKWRKVGDFPEVISTRCFYADVIFRHKWYFVMSLETDVCLKCFDLKSHKWENISISNRRDGPILKLEHASHWFYENKLYIYATEDLEKLNIHHPRSVLWILRFVSDPSVSGGVRFQWEADVMVGNRALIKCASRKNYSGQTTVVYSETASALDESAGRVYIHGGWSMQQRYYAASLKCGEVAILQGKYTSLCIEIDLNRNTIRAVEPVGCDLGPDMRGLGILGCYGGKLLMLGGCTTLDIHEIGYHQPRVFADEWICSILSEESDLVAKSAQPLPSLQVPNHTKCLNINSNTILRNSQRGLYSNLELQRRCQTMHPVGAQGMLVAKVCNEEFELFTISDIFSEKNLKFSTFAELEVLFPQIFHPSHPTMQLPPEYFEDNFLVFCFIPTTSTKREYSGDITVEQASEELLPAHKIGSYDRHKSLALSVEEHERLNGPFNDVVEDPMANRSRFFTPSAVAPVDEKCDFDKCPGKNKNRFIVQSTQNRRHSGRDIPLFETQQSSSLFDSQQGALRRCNICKIAKYCSKECQKGHWKSHKASCREPLKSTNT